MRNKVLGSRRGQKAIAPVQIVILPLCPCLYCPLRILPVVPLLKHTDVIVAVAPSFGRRRQSRALSRIIKCLLCAVALASVTFFTLILSNPVKYDASLEHQGLVVEDPAPLENSTKYFREQSPPFCWEKGFGTASLIRARRARRV
jgi:hypothetical protein